MKIEKIQLENLNSLAGTWQIDLTDPAIAGDGIFAITGKTGAGKSTILDAICLALYGATPRLGGISASDNEILHRGAAGCSAEVTFSAGGRRYTAHWSQKRARGKADGKLQPPQRELFDAAGGLIASKSRETQAEIEGITGMNFAQFTRSMLLAQGAFAAFLNADDNERAAILEKITGTALYSRLSAASFERSKAEQQKLEQLKSQLGQTVLLSGEEIAQLEQEQSQAGAAQQRQREQLHYLSQTLQQYAQLAGLHALLPQRQQAEQQAAQALTAFAPKLAELAAGRRAQQSEPAAAAFAEIEQLQRKTAQDIKTAEITRGQAEQENARVAETLQKAAAQSQNAKDARGQAQPLFDAVRALDSRIDNIRQQLHTAQAAAETAAGTAKTAKDELAALQTQQTALTAETAKNAETLARTAGDAALAGEYQAICRQLQEHQHLQQQSETAAHAAKQKAGEAAVAQEETVKAETLHRQAQETLQTLNAKEGGAPIAALQEKIEELNNRLPALENRQRLTQQVSALTAREAGLAKADEAAKTALHTAKQNHGRAQTERETAALALQKAQLERQVADLQSYRAALQEGEPCPLCGAREHPYAAHLPETGNHLQIAEQDYQQAEQAAKTAENTVIAAGKEAEFAALKLADCRAQIEELQNELAAAGGAIDAQDVQAHTLKLQELKTELAVAQHRQFEMTQAGKKLQEAVNALAQAKLKQEHAAGIAQTAGEQEARARELAADSGAALAAVLQKYGVALTGDTADVLAERRDARSRQEALARELAQQQTALTEKLASAARRSQESELAAGQAAETANAAAGALQKLQIERRAQFGEKDVQQEMLALDSQLETAQQAEKTAQAAAGQAQSALASAAAQLAQLQTQQMEHAAALQKKHAAYARAVQSAGFADIVARMEAVRTPEVLLALEEEHKALQDALSSAKQRLAEHQEQLAALVKALTDAPAQEELEAQREDVQQRYDALLEASGMRRQKLAENAAAKDRLQGLAEAIEKQQKEYEKWQQLSALIGSKEGDKFRRFVQGLTFEALVQHANRQLQKLSGRYLLLRGEEAPLSLFVLDGDQAGEVRPVKNLSGGESFIVSLALALGLSNMASENIRVDSLFLDEGFGTLDDEMLGTALDTLAQLPQDGKLIGIISHVPALKERISAQIQVEKGKAGKSRLSGAGCAGC